MSEDRKPVTPTPQVQKAPNDAKATPPDSPAAKGKVPAPEFVLIENLTKKPRMLVASQPAGVTGVFYGAHPDGMLFPEAKSRVPVALWEAAKEQEMVQRLLAAGLIRECGPFSMREMATPEAIKFVKEVTDLRFLKELQALEIENRPQVYAAILKQIEIVTAKAEKKNKE